jgi:hypothetical protein
MDVNRVQQWCSSMSRNCGRLRSYRMTSSSGRTSVRDPSSFSAPREQVAVVAFAAVSAPS